MLGALGPLLVLLSAAPPPASSAVASGPNLLLVTIDTLRADHVGCYGFAGAQTTTLDRLAREGTLIEDAVVAIPMTRPSHATLMTGRYPFEHGLRDNAQGPLSPGTPTLASVLRARGYDTAAFIGAYPVSRPSGLDQGFATFDDPFGAVLSATTRDARIERRAAEVVSPALAWLGRPRAAPFFLWVHLFDPHAPYEPPAPFAARFAKDPYDGEVAYADAQVGRLLAALDAAGRRRSTLVVVTSDHGEGLGDHGESEHMLFVYDSTLRVPLVLSWPGVLPVGARVRGQFRSVDLMPTVLGLLGVPSPAVSGASRAAELRKGTRLPDNAGYAESLYGQLHFGWAPLRAVRAEGWKLIDAPRPELFRLTEDPGERTSLADTRAPVAAALRTRLFAFEPPESRARTTPSRPADPEAAERLAALGYVAGGPAPGAAASGADPKDKLAEFEAGERGMREALRLFGRGDLAGTIRVLTPLARAAAVPFNVVFYLGRSLLESGRPAEAIAPLEKAVSLAPTAAGASLYLALAYAGAGRPPDALAALDRAMERAPRNAELAFARGRLLLRWGAPREARAALEQARALDPKDPLIRAALSGAYRNAGDAEPALTEAQAAVRLDPGSAEAQVALGLALGASGREAEAERALRQAVALAPGHADALFYLASIDLHAGRPAEAQGLFERLLARHADYPGAAAALEEARAAAAPASAPPAGAIRLRLVRVADRSRADEVARRAAAGEDFATLARALSEDRSAGAGGDLGAVRPADLAEPLRSAAAALAPGAVSPVLQTASGFVILKRER